MSSPPGAEVLAIHVGRDHHFSKPTASEIELVAGLGVAGDGHQGARVQHLSRVARDPMQPNLRQVHLIHSELFAEVQTQGFTVEPGDLGENVTTRGIDLLSLPTGTTLKLGERALLAVTGLRNPCQQIHQFQEGLLGAVLERVENGETIRRAGIMAVVILGGLVKAGDPIEVSLPPEPRVPLEPV